MGKTTGKDPWRLRKCKSCGISYKPTCRDKANAEKSIFCTRACKDRYHRSGGMNIVQLREVLTRAIMKAIKQDAAFLEALSDQLRASDMGAMACQIAKEEIQKECDSGGTIRSVIDNMQLEIIRISSEMERVRRIRGLTTEVPLGREAAQALPDSLYPGDH